VGVSETPVMRPDGTVHQVRGYDEATGYLYAPSLEYPPIPDHPTRDDAYRALALLEDVFCDFPYVAPVHRLVPVAALLSILVRPAIAGPCPAVVFDATVRGSGKTLQGDTVHAIAFGRRAPHATLPAAEEEREKVLSGYALAGARCVFIDNVKGLLGGPKLEATLTSTEVGFRILGKPDIVELQWLAVILVSGNNLQLTDDMRRRLLFCRLESPLEDPTARTGFRHELPAYALAHRAELVAAALTLVRAYLCHGAPDTGIRGLGEPYGAWSRVVAGALAFAGGGDVSQCRAPAEAVALDDVGALRVLLEGWRHLGGPLTCYELCAALAPGASGPHVEELREALETIAPPKVPGGRVDPRALGYAFRRHRGRWLGDLQLTAVSSTGHDKMLRWAPHHRSITRS
ncbi:MAG TPA: hypothetical protein VMT97_09860, partial [Terriglobales bacterium]|nr:hypothetical protein [Terriglobales bacterium]